MPLISLRLRRFKCFADSGDVPLAPLTLIFGRNNTGKSSILQSLLLLRQSLDAPENGPRLNLRGQLYPAGSYSDIVHQHRASDHIEMRLGLTLPSVKGREGPERHAVVEMEFCSDEPQLPRLTRLTLKSDRVLPLEMRRGRGAGGPYELYIGADRLGSERKANFYANQFLPAIGPEPPRPGRPSMRHEASRAFARHVFTELWRLLEDARAVDAFRQRPERRYEYAGRTPTAPDVAGRYVINAIIEDAARRRGRGELLRVVNRWLRLVGRVRLLPLRRISHVARLFEVRVKDTDSGRWANFADVGFGIGQALPVIVEGLRTPRGGTFLVQEPEIHLHPDAQLAMADFLVNLALSGRQVIAETHSEYLLLRVRRIIAQHGTDRRSKALDPSAVSLLHVKKHPNGESEIQRLLFDKLGQVTNWPEQFMEQATEERMELLKAMAKQTDL